MPDYSPNELLTRMLALERMKEISRNIAEARVYDPALARLMDAEREELKKTFLKRVK